MGKLKKPCKNAYYFFVMKEKEKEEDRGSFVYGGFQHYCQKYGHKWSTLTKEQKAPYEQMAKDDKEKDKHNPNNKFTVTGESYAQVHRKQMEQRSVHEEMEDFIDQLTSGPEVGERMFIFMKAVYSVEEIIDRKRKQYWPSELSMATFSLQGGIKAIYTQLVDTEETPTGYASQAKENCEETLLPMPGNRTLFNDDCRDYLRILKNISGFANHYLKHGYEKRGHKTVFFALDSEREPIISCLQWLVDKLSGKDRKTYQRFVDQLKVYKVSKFVLGLAEEANKVNSDYKNYLVQFKLDSAADNVLLKGNYDYREEIVCPYHRMDVASLKMHNCAQSIVMRRIYTLFDEFILPFRFERVKRHDINKLGRGIKGPVIKKKREKSPERKEMKVEEPSWLKTDFADEDNIDTWDYGSSSVAPTSPGAWGSRPAAAPSFMDDDFPTLSRTTRGSRPAATASFMDDDYPSSTSGAAGRSRPATTASFMDDDYPSSTSGATRGSRPAATASFMDDDYPSSTSGATGRSRPATTASFMDDEFPSTSDATGGSRPATTASFMDDDIPSTLDATRESSSSSSRGWDRRFSSSRSPPSPSSHYTRHGDIEGGRGSNEKRSSTRRFMDDDDEEFPSTLGAGATRESSSSSSRGWDNRFSSSRSPPSPSSHYTRHGDIGGGRGSNERRSSTRSFMDDDDEDFSSQSSSSRGRGQRY